MKIWEWEANFVTLFRWRCTNWNSSFLVVAWGHPVIDEIDIRKFNLQDWNSEITWKCHIATQLRPTQDKKVVSNIFLWNLSCFSFWFEKWIISLMSVFWLDLCCMFVSLFAFYKTNHKNVKKMNFWNYFYLLFMNKF